MIDMLRRTSRDAGVEISGIGIGSTGVVYPGSGAFGDVDLLSGWQGNNPVQDLAVARDLRKLGAAVMLIGQSVPQDAGDLVFQLLSVPPGWQFLTDIIPAQLAAEKLARLSGVDSDTFRYSSFIVEDEYGLLQQKSGSPNDKK